MRTRSKTKRTRENLNRLPREVEATLPSWVKCTDPIPREILEEVRSTVLVWMKNVRKYYEENILNDNPSGFLAFWVDVNYPYGARVFEHQIEGLLRVKEKKGAWSTFIRQMLLSDVKIIPHPSLEPTTYSYTDIVFEIFERNWNRSPGSGLKLVVYFDDDDERLSSEIKDEISSKLASALRALKSRISRICGINELERRVSLAPEAV